MHLRKSMFCAPGTDQRIPLRSIRSLTTWRQAPSPFSVTSISLPLRRFAFQPIDFARSHGVVDSADQCDED